ncbi:hypothetical protein SAMN05660206_103202 [Sphingobacterium wenxiniae]|uniref:Uncharacterized protein n=1 Tax=Sphingobacterium wenxiniae TaxID=683125 RepID=A0A1I6R8L8_9SPHI|nr:hypothetical protein SAMN05660206_103202 [Sphingobacterium wenxiniae]
MTIFGSTNEYYVNLIIQIKLYISKLGALCIITLFFTPVEYSFAQQLGNNAERTGVFMEQPVGGFKILLYRDKNSDF